MIGTVYLLTSEDEDEDDEDMMSCMSRICNTNRTLTEDTCPIARPCNNQIIEHSIPYLTLSFFVLRSEF